VLTWSVGGIDLAPVQAGDAAQNGGISTLTDVRRYQRSPRPASTANAAVTVNYEVHADGRLVLRNVPSDGNFDVVVRVTAAGGGLQRSVERQVIFRGHEVVWDDAYHREVGGCLDSLTDGLRGRIIRESPPIRRIRWPEPGPPSPLGPTVRLDRAASAYQSLVASDPAKGRELARLVSLIYDVDLAATTKRDVTSE
jgi:hypothetical protein